MSKGAAAAKITPDHSVATVRPATESPPTVHGWRRVVAWLMAGLFFMLAMIGVVLPGIPTTPFLLLMCYFLLRVSPSLHEKAMAWPVVGGPLRDWRDEGGVRRGVKVLACTMVTVLVTSTLLWSPLGIAVKWIIFLAALYGVVVVIRLPTATGVDQT